MPAYTLQLTYGLILRLFGKTFILTIPLAATSNSYMIKRLKTNWKKLHQTIYVIAILVVLHFLLLVKKDITEPIYYAAVLAFLLGIRVYYRYLKPKF